MHMQFMTMLLDERVKSLLVQINHGAPFCLVITSYMRDMLHL